MNERKPDINDYDFDHPDMRVSVEFGGYRGEARVRKLGENVLRWQISLHPQNKSRTIANWDGPEVHGDGLIIPSLHDVEEAQHEINTTIEQYLWDPMSQS